MKNVYLVTGGAGFIGSHIAKRLVEMGKKVRIIDNLSTGRFSNISDFVDELEFVEGDIRDLPLLRKLTEDVLIIFHEAAVPSVPRSIDDPITSNANNVDGTLNVLYAAKENRVKRVIYAASSSAYGNSAMLPKVESMQPHPLSPYAVAKYTGELYCRVFYNIYGLETISLRYFNVFGPKQDPNSEYAAVVPKFIVAYLMGKPPVIYGDGTQTRDFTYIDNVVNANMLAAEAKEVHGEVVNIAYGKHFSINHLAEFIKKELNSTIDPVYKEARIGDVKHSLADITLAKKIINYVPIVDTKEGLRRTIDYFKKIWEKGK